MISRDEILDATMFVDVFDRADAAWAVEVVLTKAIDALREDREHSPGHV